MQRMQRMQRNGNLKKETKKMLENKNIVTQMQQPMENKCKYILIQLYQ